MSTPILQKINLLKKNVGVVLEKKKLTGVVARVGLVLDISGSMRKLYKNGTVQSVVEKILAVASQFDDDGVLDLWIYDHRFVRLPSATERDIEDYVNKHILNDEYIPKFGRNDEPPVMRDVINKYIEEEKSNTPIFIAFINDGGVKRKSGDNIENVIIDSSTLPIFWQFVGIGNSDFGVLKKIDTINGRFIDNAGFFELNDVENVTDNELYERLLNEFPEWLKEAKSKGLL